MPETTYTAHTLPLDDGAEVVLSWLPRGSGDTQSSLILTSFLFESTSLLVLYSSYLLTKFKHINRKAVYK